MWNTSTWPILRPFRHLQEFQKDNFYPQMPSSGEKIISALREELLQKKCFLSGIAQITSFYFKDYRAHSYHKAPFYYSSRNSESTRASISVEMVSLSFLFLIFLSISKIVGLLRSQKWLKMFRKLFSVESFLDPVWRISLICLFKASRPSSKAKLFIEFNNLPTVGENAVNGWRHSSPREELSQLLNIDPPLLQVDDLHKCRKTKQDEVKIIFLSFRKQGDKKALGPSEANFWNDFPVTISPGLSQ